jgi:putative hydrolase of the HAD superfamily
VPRTTAIIFDLDNTLWEVWPVIVRAEQAMYEYLGTRYPKIVARYGIEALRTVREQVALDEPHMGHDFTYLRLASLRRCARETGYEECIAEEVFDVFYRARNDVTLYRDVEPTLARLHGRYRLFTLTNGNADLAAIGLDRYFEGSFAARTIGALKPHPSVFQHVLDRAGLSAAEVIHIGDDPVADVQGARSAGMQSLWLNRVGARWPENMGALPTTLSKLDELVDLLSR